MDPVEEFARLKDEVRRLEERLAVLRAGFLQPFARRRSNQHEVVVRLQSRRVLVRDRLPPAVLADPALWEERRTEIVTVRPLEDGPPPYRRPAGRADDILLIE